MKIFENLIDRFTNLKGFWVFLFACLILVVFVTPTYAISNLTKTITGTSETASSDVQDGSSGNERPVYIGEIVTYSLEFEVAEGTADVITITDRLPDGLQYVAGSVSLNITNATSVVVENNPPLVTGGTVSGDDVTFELGNVTNSDNDADIELITVTFDAVVNNIADNQISTILTNNAELFVNTVSTLTSEDRSVVIQEPDLTLDKTINDAFSIPATTGPFESGNTVVYDISIGNLLTPNAGTAYDVELFDDLDPNLSLITVEVFGVGYMVIDDSGTTLGNDGNVDLVISEIRPFDVVIVRVTTRVLNTVTLEQIITNTANVTYTSLPGEQGTGDATPGNSGDDNGERNGNDGNGGILNNYALSSSDDFTVLSTFDTIKSIDSTSETDTNDITSDTNVEPRPVVVGEIITYRLVTEVGQLTSPDVVKTDILSPSISYVANSTRISYVADNPLTIANAGTALNELEPTTAFSDAFVNFDGTTRELTFALGAVVNNDTDIDVELVIIEFDALVVDTATASGDIWANQFSFDIDNDDTDEDSSNQVFAQLVEPAIRIEKTFSPTEQVRGGTVTMTLVASNLASDGATSPLYDIEVTDTLDDWLDVTNITITLNATATTYGTVATNNSTVTAGYASGVNDDVRIDIDALPVDGVVTIEVTMEIDPVADTLSLPRIITNRVDMIGDSNPGNDANDRDYSDNATDDLTIVVPNLIVTKVDSADPVNAGDPLTYTITIQNTGTPAFDATGVVFTDQLPIGFTVTLVTPSQGTCAPIVGGVLTCNIGTIAQGNTATITINGITSTLLNDGAILTNITYVTSTEGNSGNDGNDTPDDGDDARAEESTTVGSAVDIAVVKTVNNNTPSEGSTIIYSLTVTNNGPAPATGIEITDSLNSVSGVTYLSDNSATILDDAANPTSYNSATGVWLIGAMDPSTSLTLEITATVDVGASALPQPIVNTANRTATDQTDSNPANDSDDANISIGGLDLAVTKTVDNPAVETGDFVIYSITATNNGPSTATGVSVLDILPAGVTYVSDNSATLQDDTATPTSYDNATGNWTIGTLNNGSSLTLEITVTVNISGGQITNTAEIIGNQPDADNTNNTDTAVVSVDIADLSVTKTVNSNAPQVGDIITYTVTVNNAGPSTAFNVELTDQLPGGVVYISDTPSQGTFDNGTGIWTVGQLNVDQSANLLIQVEVVDLGLGTTNTVEVTSSDQPDPDSTPNNGPNNEDDYAESVFIFDPPFGRKTFNQVGDAVLQWSIEWVNPGTTPVPVSFVDPVTIGTFLPGSLTCTTLGTATTISNCTYDPGTNSILTEAVIAPDPGATPATTSTSNNRLTITFQMAIPDTINQIENTGTLTTVSGDVVTVFNTWTRAIPPVDTASGAGDVATVEITKFAEPTLAFPGENLAWIIVVTNNSTSIANNLMVTDMLSDSLSIQTTNSDGGSVVVAGQNVTWSIPTLNPGASMTLRIDTLVASTLTESISNTALLDGDNVEASSSTAVASLVEALPATGEISWMSILGRLLIGMLIVCLSLGWGLRRYRRIS